MFGGTSKDNAPVSSGVNALLEQGCEFEGKLTFSGTVKINGSFKGDIFSNGTLILGDSAQVEGRLEVGNLLVRGHFVGEVVATEQIEMQKPAQVRGNIIAKTLVIEAGAIFEGNCRMGTVETLDVVSRLDTV